MIPSGVGDQESPSQRNGEEVDRLCSQRVSSVIAAEHHAPGTGRAKLPSLEFRREDGTAHAVYGYAAYETLRAAALAAGAEPGPAAPPGIEDALRRFGTMAAAEVAAVCQLPGPRGPAELWRLAVEWRVRPERCGGGELWTVS